MTSIPREHVIDAHKLVTDAEVDLFQLTPLDGSGTIYFKADNNVTWQGNNYEGLPLSFTGFKKSSEGGTLAPKLTIGDGSADLSPFKPLVYDGYLDGATVVHIHLLLDNLINNRNIREQRIYRVKRVPGYSRLSIELQLATSSDALGFTIPHRQYHPPAFPAVYL
jgi:phage-related protein